MLKARLLLPFTILLILGCTPKSEVRSVTFSGLGTVLNIVYIGDADTNLENEIKADTAAVEDDFSYYRPDSWISKLNKNAAKEPVAVPAHVCRLIRESLELGEQSGGYFDITYKSQGALWEDNKGTVPTDSELEGKKQFVGSDKVEADCKKNLVKFKYDGVKIDLGGVAKGYAIDRAGAILKKHKISDFIVNYGGDMLVCGKKNGKNWTIGIKNPENPQQMLKKIEFGSENECIGIATSGDYERFFTIDGKNYSHIMNPKTGKPVKNVHSVTVTGRNATITDLAATAAAVAIYDEAAVKKIMEKFAVKIYSLSGDERFLIDWQQ